jgi:osmotically-inducible protein OsmY
MPHTDDENLSEINFDSSVNLGRINERDRDHFGKGPKAWIRSDERIREEVSMALFIDHIVDASDIDVVVKDGVVFLAGTVLDRAMKTAAERSVERLAGVKDVMNQLIIAS